MKNFSPKQAVELFHLLFLDQLQHKLDNRLYALKGGCNLRFFFNSIRYSEDIDLDIQTVQRETLQHKIDKLLEGQPFQQILQAKGLSITDTHAVKQTQTTQRWKLKVHTQHSQLGIPTKIEFSRRGPITNAQTSLMMPHISQLYQLAPILVSHYDANQAFSQKVEALIHRSQTQARDVFDLHLLIQQGAKQQGQPATKEIEHAKQNALSISFEDFKSQVVAYLQPEHIKTYSSADTWHSIASQVINSLTS